MHEKAIWKGGICEIAKALRGIAPGPRLTAPIWGPSGNGQHADIHWVLAYDLKTQSLMKNRGLLKGLDQTLLKDYINQYWRQSNIL